MKSQVSFFEQIESGAKDEQSMVDLINIPGIDLNNHE